MWNPQGLYANFIFRQPVIFHGKESVRGLFDFPGNRVAVIYGQGMSEQARDMLENIFKRRSLCFIKKSWREEPRLDELHVAVEQLEAFNPDTIIAFGGGAVIDGAKLCRISFEFPYVEWGDHRLSQMTFKTRFIAIPTTVGSGAEASSAAVYYSEEERTKKVIICHSLQPDVLVLDPAYIKNAPDAVIQFSLADALAHMIEGYVSNIKNPIAEEMALWGISSIRQEVEKCDKDKVDFLRLQYAGYLGGIVQNHCLVGAAHAFAHQMTAYGYSHGKAVALLLLRAIQMNRRDKDTDRLYQQMAEKTGFEGIDMMVAFLRKIISCAEKEDAEKLGGIMKQNLSDKVFIQNIKSDSGGQGNPVPITDRYVEEFIGGFDYELYGR